MAQIVHVGLGCLPVMLGTLAICLSVAALVGRRLGVVRDLRTLTGVGTGICGASATAVNDMSSVVVPVRHSSRH